MDQQSTRLTAKMSAELKQIDATGPPCRWCWQTHDLLLCRCSDIWRHMKTDASASLRMLAALMGGEEPTHAAIVLTVEYQIDQWPENEVDRRAALLLATSDWISDTSELRSEGRWVTRGPNGGELYI